MRWAAACLAGGPTVRDIDQGRPTIVSSREDVTEQVQEYPVTANPLSKTSLLQIHDPAIPHLSGPTAHPRRKREYAHRMTAPHTRDRLSDEGDPLGV